MDKYGNNRKYNVYYNDLKLLIFDKKKYIYIKLLHNILFLNAISLIFFYKFLEF